MAPYTHPSFAYWENHLKSARDGYSRPIGNNTRVHWRTAEADAIAIRYHATDIVTIYRDGTRQLAANGWWTVTTAQRMNSYGSARRGSDRGNWYVRARPTASDPQPEWPYRSIPKPYRAPNPGAEPLDDGVGCIAGRVEEYSYQHDDYLFSDHDQAVAVQQGIFTLWTESGRYLMGRRAINGRIVYGSAGHNSQWGEGADSYIPLGANDTYEQCPHCRAFRARHERWRQAMHGDRYPRSLRSERGYEQMTEMLERFGSREAWQEAYITEFRAVKEAHRQYRAWERRNRVPFHDGIWCDADGYASEKEARTWRRDLKLIEKEERRRARLHAQVERERKRIEAKYRKRRKKERALRREIAHNMAAALINELEITRRESFV